MCSLKISLFSLSFQFYPVLELKQVLKGVAQLPFARKQGWILSLSSKRKQQLVDMLLGWVFDDFPACRRPRAQLLLEMRYRTNQIAQSTNMGMPIPMPIHRPMVAAAAATHHMPCIPGMPFILPATATTAAFRSPSLQTPAAKPPRSVRPSSSSASRGNKTTTPVATATASKKKRARSQMSASSLSRLSAAAAAAAARQVSRQASTPISSITTPRTARVKQEPDFHVETPANTSSTPASAGVARLTTPYSSSQTNTTGNIINNNGDDERSLTQPRTDTERRLLAQLLQMGFPDQAEILSSIRKLASDNDNDTSSSNNNNTITADVVMVDIISQREEAEEAKKMDVARKLSEQSRKAEAKQLRNVVAEENNRKRRDASWSEWMKPSKENAKIMYPDSWILQETREALEDIVQKNVSAKDLLLELLELEKKAHKWYKGNLPRSYFRATVSKQLITAATSSSSFSSILACLLKALRKQIQVLQQHMFQLSSQQGGVPRLFLDAQQEDTEEQQHDSQDEVVLIGVDKATAIKENSLPARKTKTAVPEIIEVL